MHRLPGQKSACLLLTGLILILGGGRASRAQTVPLPRQPRPAVPLPRSDEAAQAARLKQALSLTTHSWVRRTVQPTSGTLRAYSTRPLMAVGDIMALDLTSRTVTVAINRDLSTMPPNLVTMATRLGELNKLTEREFPKQRIFPISRNTALLDERILDKVPPRPAETEKERMDRITVKLQDFHVGERVSVYFTINPDPRQPPIVRNIKKQDPSRTEYSAIYRPIPIQQRMLNQNEVTTRVRANAVMTSGPLPRGLRPLPQRSETNNKP